MEWQRKGCSETEQRIMHYAKLCHKKKILKYAMWTVLNFSFGCSGE